MISIEIRLLFEKSVSYIDFNKNKISFVNNFMTSNMTFSPKLDNWRENPIQYDLNKNEMIQSQ